MKKLFVLAMVLSLGVIVVSCGGKKLGGAVKGETIVTEGWIDENTFKVTAVGFPKEGITHVGQKKATAQNAAVTVAQAKVLEKFKGARIEGAGGVVDNRSTGDAIAKEFGGMVRGGSVGKVTCDEQGTECEIEYTVYKKGLKKSVMGNAAVE